MRVNRALEKLRTFLARRGVALSAAVIAGALSANAVQAAPPALLGSVAVAAAKGTSLTTSTSTLIKGTLKLMAWTKLKIAGLAGVGIVLACGTAIVAVKTMRAPVPHPVRTAAATEEIWDQYSQAMALSGPATDAAIPAAVQVMTNHPRIAVIRASQMQQIPPRRGAGMAGGIQRLGNTRGAHCIARLPGSSHALRLRS